MNTAPLACSPSRRVPMRAVLDLGPGDRIFWGEVVVAYPGLRGDAVVELAGRAPVRFDRAASVKVLNG